MSTPDARAQVETLHQQIMNLPSKPKGYGDRPEEWRRGYGFGHKDARHAAAELVGEALASVSPPPSPPPREGCINCGETEAGGYMSGRLGHIDEGAVGPFCAECWDMLRYTFVGNEQNAEAPAPPVRPASPAPEGSNR